MKSTHLLALSILLFTACSPNVEDYMYATYNSADGLYSIDYPDGWEESVVSNSVNFRDPDTSSTFGIRQVTLYDETDLEVLMDDYQDAMSSGLTLEELERSEFTISNVTGLYSEFVVTVSGKKSDTDLQMAVWMIPLNEDSMLQLSFNSVATYFEDLLPAAQYMLDSLQIKN